MGTQVIDKTATTSGSPAAVYAFLADGSTWPAWSPLGTFELLEPGDGSPEGLGAVRLFTTGRHRSRERVVERVPGQRFAYVLEAGLALRDYSAVITLVPSGDGGTAITWRSTFRAKVPGTGWVYRRQLGAFIGQTVDGLAAAAAEQPERPARPGRPAHPEQTATAG
jgi:Polyketide cyclase / dehydrase and lipid transport